jgi:hypothetical protein
VQAWHNPIEDGRTRKVQGAFARVIERLGPYFADGGHMIDQARQPRLREGMVHAYLVQGRVAGFGRQAINALYPGTAENAAPRPGPRVYSGPDDPGFQGLRRLLDERWSGCCALCEINVSSVSPYPESANAALVEAVRALSANAR